MRACFLLALASWNIFQLKILSTNLLFSTLLFPGLLPYPSLFLFLASRLFLFFFPSSPPLFRSSLLHLSGLELLSKYVVALNLRMKTWIACN